MANTNGHGQPTIQLPLQPVPNTVTIAQGQVNGKGAVILTIQSPTGLFGVFLEPEGALKIAEDLRRIAAAAKAGLYLPGGPDG